MTRMWEIREGYDPDERHGYGRGEDAEYEEGFEDGCEHGYMKAMREMGRMGMRDTMGGNSGSSNYGSGSDSGRMGNRYIRRGGRGMGMMPPYPSYREEEDEYDDDDYNERRGRRRRDSRGRYM